MALSGVHVACCNVGGPGVDGSPHELVGKVEWSETLTVSGSTSTTSRAAPGTMIRGKPSFEIFSSVAIYVATGPSPDPTQASGAGQSARLYVDANTYRNIFCEPGDKLACVAA